MKNYLSYGGGVNTVAMYLLLCEQGVDFEPIFVNHGTDWPETYEYFNMFSEYCEKNGFPKITVLRPNIQGFTNLMDYCVDKKMVPAIMNRWCTSKFKLKPIGDYVETPCFMTIGIDYGERKRAKISMNKGIENRYPLIENELYRDDCKGIIKRHRLPIPMKSGCYICPFQRINQWKELRRKHPDLFCRAEKLEKINMDYRKSVGKKPLYLNAYPKATLRNVIEEKQMMLFEQDEYPPCQCGL